jgi:hypothetical protein
MFHLRLYNSELDAVSCTSITRNHLISLDFLYTKREKLQIGKEILLSIKAMFSGKVA